MLFFYFRWCHDCIKIMFAQNSVVYNIAVFVMQLVIRTIRLHDDGNRGENFCLRLSHIEPHFWYTWVTRSWSTCQTVFLDCSTFIAVIEHIYFIDCIQAQCRDTSRQNVVTFHHTRVRFPFAPFNEFRGGVFHACCVFLWVFGRPFILFLEHYQSLPVSNVCIHKVHRNRDRRYKSPLQKNFHAIKRLIRNRF